MSSRYDHPGLSREDAEHAAGMPPVRRVEDDIWVRTRMPVVIRFMVAEASDEWLRQTIRGIRTTEARTQDVIVQGTAEADRVCAAMARKKYARQLPYGGCSRRRLR